MRVGFVIRLSVVCLLLSVCFVDDAIFSVKPIQSVPENDKRIISSVQRVDRSVADDIRLPKPLRRTDLFLFPEEIMSGKVWIDSDGDGVADSLDQHPYETRTMINPVYRVPFAGKEYVFRLSIAPDYVEVYRDRMPHELHENGDNIASFVAKDDPYISEIVAQAKAYAKDEPKLDVQGLLLAFAKSFPYNPDAYTGAMEYPKYPIETLVDQSGDCEDLAILAASLVGEYHGYDRVVFVYFPEHMGIAIRTTDKEIAYRKKKNMESGHVKSDGEVFIYQETTDPVWVLGQIPDAYKKKATTVYRIGA